MQNSSIGREGGREGGRREGEGISEARRERRAKGREIIKCKTSGARRERRAKGTEIMKIEMSIPFSIASPPCLAMRLGNENPARTFHQCGGALLSPHNATSPRLAKGGPNQRRIFCKKQRAYRTRAVFRQQIGQKPNTIEWSRTAVGWSLPCKEPMRLFPQNKNCAAKPMSVTTTEMTKKQNFSGARQEDSRHTGECPFCNRDAMRAKALLQGIVPVERHGRQRGPAHKGCGALSQPWGAKSEPTTFRGPLQRWVLVTYATTLVPCVKLMRPPLF